jgi:hypothetical protein
MVMACVISASGGVGFDLAVRGCFSPCVSSKERREPSVCFTLKAINLKLGNLLIVDLASSPRQLRLHIINS